MDGTRARAVLGVTEHASPEDLQRAFRARAKQTHPDTGGSSEAFQTARRALIALQSRTDNSATTTAAMPPVSATGADTASALDYKGDRGGTHAPRAQRLDVYDCTPPAITIRASDRRLEFAHFLAGALAQRAAA